MSHKSRPALTNTEPTSKRSAHSTAQRSVVTTSFPKSPQPFGGCLKSLREYWGINRDLHLNICKMCSHAYLLKSGILNIIDKNYLTWDYEIKLPVKNA